MAYSINNLIKDGLTGNINIVSKEVKKFRIETCESCDSFSKLTRQCKICLCFCDFKSKFVESECPLEKW